MYALRGTLRVFVLTCLLFGLFIPKSTAQQQELTDPTVYSFTLIDARTDEPIRSYDPIPDNAVINLNQLPLYMNIRVNTMGDVGSVKFDFIDRDRYHVENLAPFSLFGDVNGDFNDGRLREGTHTVTATPYPKNKARGEAGISSSITINVVREGESMGFFGFIERAHSQSMTPYLQDWLTTDHFLTESDLDELFDNLPEGPGHSILQSGDTLNWSQHTSPIGVVNLSKGYPVSARSALAFTRLESPEAQRALFRIGITGPAKIWINQKLVYEAKEHQEFELDDEVFFVDLKPGTNEILVKSSPWLRWAFSLSNPLHPRTYMETLWWPMYPPHYLHCQRITPATAWAWHNGLSIQTTRSLPV